MFRFPLILLRVPLRHLIRAFPSLQHLLIPERPVLSAASSVYLPPTAKLPGFCWLILSSLGSQNHSFVEFLCQQQTRTWTTAPKRKPTRLSNHHLNPLLCSRATCPTSPFSTNILGIFATVLSSKLSSKTNHGIAAGAPQQYGSTNFHHQQ